MRILFISNRFPIPHRDGIEIPISQIMQGLSAKHDIFFAMVYETEYPDQTERNRIDNSPKWIKKVYFIKTKKPQTFKSILAEMLLLHPAFYETEYDLFEVKKTFNNQSFDVLWATPVGLGGFCNFYKKYIDPTATLCLGINEPLYTLYLSKMKLCIKGRIKFNLREIAQILRLPFIYFNERKYLKKFDIIHVQTETEKKRVYKLTGKKKKPFILVAPNPINNKLLGIQYKRPPEDKILYLTSLNDARSLEAIWFLEKIWPRIKGKKQDLEILIVGLPAPTTLAAKLSRIPGVVLLGYVDNMPDIFKSVTLSILPIIQNHGLINRALDSLSAGIPLIGYPGPLKTIDGFISEIHGIIVESPSAIVNKILELLSDDNKLLNLSIKGRELAIKHPKWVQSIKEIESVLIKSHSEMVQ